MNDDKRKLLGKLTIEESGENLTDEETAILVAYLFIAEELKERLFSGLFHKSVGVLNDTGDKLFNLRDDLLDKLQKLGRVDYDDLEDDYADMLKGIKGANIEARLQNEP